MRLISVFFVASLIFPSLSMGEGRLSVADNAPVTEFKEALSSVVGAFDSEDLDAFESCFTESMRKGLRRKMALLFASEDCGMELVESHTIEVGDNTAEAAVRYRVSGSSGVSEFVSIVKAVRADGKWLIDSELKVRGGSVASSSTKRYDSARPGAVESGRRVEAPEKEEADDSDINPALRHLVGDLDVTPGVGCVGGKCPPVRRNP